MCCFVFNCGEWLHVNRFVLLIRSTIIIFINGSSSFLILLRKVLLMSLIYSLMDQISIVTLFCFLFEDVELRFCSAMQKIHVMFFQNGLYFLDIKVDYLEIETTEIIDTIAQEQEVYIPSKSIMKALG